ncbi:hypothetical protein C8Q80DRAFT_276176 [Daedaleopsis nitida]|nr:hypothetical protein C8Q80DRAFT_276176 [Daedaleopsis nitida]
MCRIAVCRADEMKNRHTYRFSGLAHCLPQQGARTDQYLYLSPALPSTHSRQHVQRALLPAPTMGSYRSRECACADVPAVRGSVHLRALPRNQPASRPRPPTHVAKSGTRHPTSRMLRAPRRYHAPTRLRILPAFRTSLAASVRSQTASDVFGRSTTCAPSLSLDRAHVPTTRYVRYTPMRAY